MQKSYLFYDVETSGLNKCFDQVLQFAAIRTDLSLQELERETFFVRLNSDLIPSPDALITHRIGLQRLADGLSEFDAIGRIHRLLNQPGTISVGYNTLGFDDEFLRFSFYRNLLAPYTHQYANECSRMDLYPLAAMYYLFKPEVLVWPETAGKPSLRLEHLSQANNLASGAAHDAMVDVEATLMLARRFKAETQMWDYLLGFFDKKTDLARQLQLDTIPGVGKQALLINPKQGAAAGYQAPVLALGQHQHYKNQSLWLHLDEITLSQTTAQTIPETTRVTQKKTAETGFVLPWKSRFLHHLSQARYAQMEANIEWLAAQPQLLEKIKEYYQHYTYPKIANLDIVAALYQRGFWSDQEMLWMANFWRATWPARAAMLDHAASTDVYELALRIVGRHQRPMLSERHVMLFNEYYNELQAEPAKAVDYRGEARLTAKQALSRIEELTNMGHLDAEQQRLLQELHDYLLNLR